MGRKKGEEILLMEEVNDGREMVMGKG